MIETRVCQTDLTGNSLIPKGTIQRCRWASPTIFAVAVVSPNSNRSRPGVQLAAYGKNGISEFWRSNGNGCGTSAALDMTGKGLGSSGNSNALDAVWPAVQAYLL